MGAVRVEPLQGGHQRDAAAAAPSLSLWRAQSGNSRASEEKAAVRDSSDEVLRLLSATEMARSRGLFRPDARLRVVWDAALLLAVTFYAMAVPVHAAFALQSSAGWVVANVVTLALLWVGARGVSLATVAAASLAALTWLRTRGCTYRHCRSVQYGRVARG